MRKATILTLLMIVMIVFTVKSQTATVPSGSGTSGNPYQIATVNNLYWLSQNDTVWDKYFIQTANINAAETRNWNISGSDTLGFSPIGNNNLKFRGTYNGQGHIIDSLFINRTSTNYIGLFGKTYSCSISNIGVTNANIIGVNYTACITGWLSGTLENSFSTGTIYGNSYLGGLVGTCYGTINNCYSNTNVSGPTNSSALGGLVGSNGGSGSISNSYSTGSVTNGYSGIGGLVGYQQNGTITSNSFWDTETSGQSTSAGGTGKTTAEMQTLTTFTDSTWDFVGETANGTNNYWDMISCLSEYPTLSWQVFETPNGSGTTSDPYQIATLADLRWLSENSCVWDKNFIQTANINAAETHNWNISGNDTLGFSPIGNNTVKFHGTYNGKGHSIDNLFINRQSDNYIGFFGYIFNHAKVDSISLTNVNIKGGSYDIGGLIGMAASSCSISYCSTTGNVEGNKYVGGLIGFQLAYCSLSNSFSEADVIATQYASGLVGINNNSNITNSYCSGNITSGDNTGGLVGFAANTVNIDNCYSISHITTSSTIGIGGFIGFINGTNTTISNSFWDTQTSGQTTSAGGTGKTTAQMQTLTNYTDSTWDFVGETANGTNDYWDISCVNGGYPYLYWQTNLTFTTPTGSGTIADPYQIATLNDLRWLSENSCVWDKNFIQTADINAAETRNWNISGTDTLGFSPIGNSTTNFTGSYNGQGYIIDNLFIDRPVTNYIGLFGFANGVTIDSLGVINCDITASSNLKTGVIVGAIYSSNIRNCYSTGYVTGATYIGGLLGSSQSSEIRNCYSNVEVTSTSSYVGGLTGKINSSNIINCYSTGVVDGGSSNVGGLIGGISNFPSITNSFWDTETSGQSTSAGGTGKTTAEMQTLTTFTDSTWDFVGETANGTNDYWDMNSCLSEYPTLSWQVFETPNGSGTTSDPYQIATLADLRWLSENSCVWDKNFIQTANINAAETHNWNISGSDTLGFSPIGMAGVGSFSGSYNGQGHIIDSLFINKDEQMMGMFGYVAEIGLIENIGVTNAYVNNHTNLRVGALVGNLNGSVNNCYSTGNVIGNDYAGGLIGVCNVGSIISNSYNRCNVTSTSYVGGLTGAHYGNIQNCYSAGIIVGSGSDIGGLIGYLGSAGTVSNSFWDKETSGQSTSAGGTGKTTAQMQQMCVYNDSLWDFMNEAINGNNDIWGLNDSENGGYPFLAWQGYTHTATLCGCNATGSGTTSDPYQIATLADLRWLSETSCVWDKNFIQTADINAADTRNWNISGTDTLGFSPIGNSTTNFTGSYNGQGHIIDSLFIDRHTQDYIGLFGDVESANIDSLGIINANIFGTMRVGILTGLSNNSIINACFTSGNAESSLSNIGGIVGRCQATTIRNSYAGGNITGNDYAGGITGFLINSSLIENCYSNCNVNANLTNLGGLIGAVTVGTTTNSFYNIDSTATSASGTGLTTTEMQQMCVYADSTWDFMLETVNGTNDIWGLNANENGGYPFLAWQGYNHTEECCGYIDLTNPITPVLTDVFGECSATATAPTTTDNCAGTILGTTTDTLTYSTQGTHIITWTFDDGHGNSITANQNVIVNDTVKPTLDCVSNQTVIADSSHTYLVQATEFDPISTSDNCAVVSIINDYNNNYTLANDTIPEGNTTIVWTVTDINGNTEQCSFDIIVGDYVGIRIAKKLSVNIYPNPTTGKIYLDFAENHINQIVVTDITGKQIFNKTEVKQKEMIDLSNFKIGIYIIIIQSDNEIITSKILRE